MQYFCVYLYEDINIWNVKKICNFQGLGRWFHVKHKASMRTRFGSPAPMFAPSGHGGPPGITELGRWTQRFSRAGWLAWVAQSVCSKSKTLPKIGGEHPDLLLASEYKLEHTRTGPIFTLNTKVCIKELSHLNLPMAKSKTRFNHNS